MDVRQQHSEQYQAVAQTAAQPSVKQRHTFPNGHWLLPFMGGILLSLLVIVATAALHHQQVSLASSDVDADKYQAVFMTNGQVYFGKLSKETSLYSNLTDVYYLQVQQAVQPAAKKTADQQSQVSLSKLGSELHGPTDKMHIARDQILFWENLKDDSAVVKAIKNYRAGS